MLAARSDAGVTIRALAVGQATTVVTLLGLCLTGTLAAHAGGASRVRGALRVTFWGAIAMAAAALVGQLFNVAG